tara:strand:- start:1093 stop:1590 length:498 start_codon:yes stop_codon:yes gene_type:complete
MPRGRAAVLLLVTWISGCAYYSTSSGMLGGIRSLAIPVAENDTVEFEIAERITERAGNAFTEDGQLRIVDEEGADALLLLHVVRLDDRAFTYTATEETEQYRFKVFVDVELLKVSDDERLLSLEQVEGWGTYDASLEDEEGRDLAVDAALDMIIEEIVDRTTASW